MSQINELIKVTTDLRAWSRIRGYLDPPGRAENENEQRVRRFSSISVSALHSTSFFLK